MARSLGPMAKSTDLGLSINFELHQSNAPLLSFLKRYVGSFLHNEMTSHGIYTWADGDKYITLSLKGHALGHELLNVFFYILVSWGQLLMGSNTARAYTRGPTGASTALSFDNTFSSNKFLIGRLLLGTWGPSF